ncbi:Transcriptional regulator ATRX [Frankliniella fusca]|uniref:Transcriptional regulator ATRX n=1 Tax=Frankliniella fusca TaxID=407009 RepID=A0AAE1HDB9_9NEOP|nr:Transcriptional regulator ATRX [Frankliniella fusca]
MNGVNEASNSTSDSDTPSSGHHVRMSNGLSDGTIQLNNCTNVSASTSFGGARPKTREFDESRSNGVQHRHQSTQACLENDFQTPKSAPSETSNAASMAEQNNLSNEPPKEVRTTSDIECQPEPSLSFCRNEKSASDASRLAAVCAASSQRAMAERARIAQHGTVKRPSSPVHSDSSSDTGNDDGLSGDECCIYTYKGDQNADLSNGLLGLSLPQANEHPVPPHPVDDTQRNGGSSPEMDFLEMDFDPDPLGEQDSVEEDNIQDEILNRPDHASSSPSPSAEEVSNELSAPALSPEHSSSEEGAGVLMESSDNSDSEEMVNVEPDPYGINVGASTSADSINNLVLPKVPSTASREILRGQHIAGSQLCPVDIDETHKHLFTSAIKPCQSNTEPVLDKQKFNLYSALYHSIMANNLILDEEEDEHARCVASGSENQRSDEASGGHGCPQKKLCQQNGNEFPELEKTMIWTEREACHKQVSQIAVSACGAAAVSNVLVSNQCSALNIPFTLEQVHDGVATRLRAEKANLPTYLFSRAAAGAAHKDLMRGLDLASEGAVFSRFFHMYPERAFSLSRWLAHWIKQGAVPIATLNIQRSVIHGATIPDSWHHQMIFGVSHRGVYLTNPLECVSEENLHPQLCSPSELLVRRQDIVSRWSPDTDLYRLAISSDIRWKQMNVLGQVVNVLRECHTRPTHYLLRRHLTSHITIPASYCSGILLSVLKDSPAAMKLKSASELPLKVF